MFTRFLLSLMMCGMAHAADWVPVKGGVLQPGIRLDDFEMLDHPVTNAEYKLFVDDAKYTSPPYWDRGRIPAGMENLPVVFVSRYADVAAYTKWRSAKEGRVYRLPTMSEFEYAAQAGRPDIKYVWGNDAPADHANYSPGGRNFGGWKQYLKPVRAYPANPWGLYDMAGNVFQMVNIYPDFTLGGFIFRITSPDDREGWAMGGSWARGEYYLGIEVAAYQLEGTRHPDLGFRLVRGPLGSTHFRREIRRLLAAPAGDGKVFLSWQLLATDRPDTGFHIYRTQYRDAAGDRITKDPVTDSTNFVDPAPPPPRPLRLKGGPDEPEGEGLVYYRVRAVGPDGKEGPPTPWTGVDPKLKKSGLVAYFEPHVKQGGFVPMFGDLDGDGVVDAVFRLDNGISERSADPGVPVELEAFTSYGKSIWRRPLVDHDQCFGNANNSPALLWDLDGDGKAEVIARVQEGDEVYLAVLDGRSGKTRRKTPWPPLLSDFSRSSTRINMGIAYLDGKHPAIITQSGLYENETFTAYDANLKMLWQFKSLGETNGSGAHFVVAADVDGDGKDEVFDGSTCLNPNGTVRWSTYNGHPDEVMIKHIMPGISDRQVFYAVEDNANAGAYVVDAKTGKVIWKANREMDPRWTHAHIGWAADIWDGSPGLEILTNRDGHTVQDTVLFSADGKILMNPFPRGWNPVNWLGNQVRELMSGNGRQLGRFTGKAIEPMPAAGPSELQSGACNVAADLGGDYRDEIVCTGPARSGNGRAVYIYTNTEPIRQRGVTRLASREYLEWLARNLGAGYGSYFEWQPGGPGM